MKRDENSRRVHLNVDLKQAAQQVELLKWSLAQLECSVHKKDNSAIANDLEELGIIFERAKGILKEILMRVVVDVSDRVDLEKIALKKVRDYAHNTSTLRLYLLNGFGSIFKVVLVDYLGLTRNYPDYADELVKLLSAFSVKDIEQLKLISDFFEEQAQKLMKKSEETPAVQVSEREDLRYLLDLIVALHSFSVLLSVGARFQGSEEIMNALEDATQMCCRALKNLVHRYIDPTHVQVELFEEIRNALYS